MVYQLEEVASPTLRWINFLLQLCGQPKSLCVNPALLVFRYKETSKLLLFFDFVKVVHNDSHKQVENKLTTKHHEYHKIEYHNWRVVELWLHGLSILIW